MNAQRKGAALFRARDLQASSSGQRDSPCFNGAALSGGAETTGLAYSDYEATLKVTLKGFLVERKRKPETNLDILLRFHQVRLRKSPVGGIGRRRGLGIPDANLLSEKLVLWVQLPHWAPTRKKNLG